ncbi:MAG TPA: recombinase family protein [Symbiobacteriaceae bacterium]|nr:recombinase family protein [Symbiobacteriaceae bacterium]
MTTALLVFLVYLRVSTADQGKRGFSLPEQREQCLKKVADLAAGQPYETVIIEDIGGGDILERPKLTELREFVCEQRPTHFVCMDPDRFSRETFIQLLVTREIEGVGAQLVFINHNYENTAEGKLFYTLRGAISQFEKAKILDRTKTGLRRKLKVGQVANGTHPYGYDYDVATDTLVIVPDEAVWVEQIFKWRAERLQPMEIRDRLAALGVPTKRGKVWRSSTIQGMLRNTTYVGKMRCLRWNTAGYKQQRQLPKELRKLTPKQRPPEEWTTVPVPAIISDELFAAVQAVLRTNKRQAQRGAGLLSGLAVCGLCGGPVHYTSERNGTYSMRCYHRSPRRDLANVPKKCGLPYVAAHIMESTAWAEVIEWLARPDELVRRLEREAKDRPADSRLAETTRLRDELSRALAEVQTEHVNLLQMVMRGQAHQSVADSMLKEQTARIEALKAQLATTEQLIGNLTAQRQVSDQFRRNLYEVHERLNGDERRVRKALAELPPEKRQHLVRIMVERALILPGRQIQLIPNDPASLPRGKHIPSGT